MAVNTLGSHMRTDPALYANALNILLMILYVNLDYERGYVTDHPIFGTLGFEVAGAGYVLDSLLYFASWEGAVPHPDGVSMAAEYTNMLGSLLYFATSFMYDAEASNPADVDAVFIMEAVATVVFFLSALCSLFVYVTAFEWCDEAYQPVQRTEADRYEDMLLDEADRSMDARSRAKRRKLAFTGPAVTAMAMQIAADIDFWAVVLNLIPATLYMLSAAGTLQLHYTSRDSLLGGAAAAAVGHGAAGRTSVAVGVLGARGLRSLARRLAPLEDGRRPSLLVNISRSYVIGDLMWLFDAVLYMWSWHRAWKVWWEEHAPGADKDISQVMELDLLGRHKSAKALATSSGKVAVLPDYLEADGAGSSSSSAAAEDEETGYHVLGRLHGPFVTAMRTLFPCLFGCMACCARLQRSLSSTTDVADDDDAPLVYDYSANEWTPRKVGNWPTVIDLAATTPKADT